MGWRGARGVGKWNVSVSNQDLGYWSRNYIFFLFFLFLCFFYCGGLRGGVGALQSCFSFFPPFTPVLSRPSCSVAQRGRDEDEDVSRFLQGSQTKLCLWEPHSLSEPNHTHWAGLRSLCCVGDHVERPRLLFTHRRHTLRLTTRLVSAVRTEAVPRPRRRSVDASRSRYLRPNLLFSFLLHFIFFLYDFFFAELNMFVFLCCHGKYPVLVWDFITLQVLFLLFLFV